MHFLFKVYSFLCLFSSFPLHFGSFHHLPSFLKENIQQMKGHEMKSMTRKKKANTANDPIQNLQPIKSKTKSSPKSFPNTLSKKIAGAQKKNTISWQLKFIKFYKFIFGCFGAVYLFLCFFLTPFCRDRVTGNCFSGQFPGIGTVFYWPVSRCAKSKAKSIKESGRMWG